MSYDRQKVIDWAFSQIGYHEIGDNWNKYAEALDKENGFYNGKKQGFAWCDIFVDAGFVECYGRAGAQFLLCQPDNSAGAGCSFSAQYFNAKGQFHKSNPQPGDQIFFGSAWNNVWHTGLVVAVSSNYVTTIEGNSGDQVAKRVYRLADPTIWGYGRPDWGEQPESPVVVVHDEPSKGSKTYSVDLPMLMIGDKGGYVKAAQTLLIALGYDCGNKPIFGTEKADGDFGRMTEKAVGFFQSKSGLTIDGIIGGETWAALLKF